LRLQAVFRGKLTTLQTDARRTQHCSISATAKYGNNTSVAYCRYSYQHFNAF